MKYKMTLIINLLKEWANVEDFIEEIEAFNGANSGVINVKIKETKELKEEE